MFLESIEKGYTHKQKVQKIRELSEDKLDFIDSPKKAYQRTAGG